MILYAGCRAGCCTVARFVAGGGAALLSGKPLILGEFCYCLYFHDNESNEESKENIRSKNNRPDIRLQVLRCPLPDFVAVSFAGLFHLWRQMLMQNNKEKKREKQDGRKKVQFIVTREFSGSQTMQEAFEQLIERQACGQFEEWLERKAG